MKSFFTLLILTSLINLTLISAKASATAANTVSVVSLNIKWFGRGGSLYGSVEDEYRAPYLKDYILNVLPKSDIYTFQEITDKKALFEIMSDFDCFSYDSQSERRQFVVMCSKKGILKSFSVNQEVRLGRWGLRAAVIGNYKINNEIIKVIGVHLKAGNKDTQVRLDQIEALKESFDKKDINKDINKELKTIIIGDFNTYKTDRTNLKLDDSELISLSLGDEYSLVKNKTATYMGFGGRVFDRAWVKGFASSKASVIGPCKKGSVEIPYSDNDYYREFISDHCALRLVSLSSD